MYTTSLPEDFCILNILAGYFFIVDTHSPQQHNSTEDHISGFSLKPIREAQHRTSYFRVLPKAH